MSLSGSRMCWPASVSAVNEWWVSEEWRRFLLWLLFFWGSGSTAASRLRYNRARPSRENILFRFSRSVVKGLGTLALSSSRRSLALSSPPLSLPFASPQVLSNLSPGEEWKVCGSSLSRVFLMCVFASVCTRTHVCLARLLSVQMCVSMCVSMCVHAAQCVLCLKPATRRPYKAPRV